MSYLIGDTVLLEVDFTKKGTGQPFDPQTVILQVQRPDGSVWNSSFAKDSPGSYSSNCVPDQIGKWLYRWEGNDVQSGAMEGSFFVEASSLSP